MTRRTLLLAALAVAVSRGWAQPRDASGCPIVLGESECEGHCDCNRAACTLFTISPDDACECEAGYGGPTCDDDVNECLTAPCGEHGAQCAESTGGPVTPVPCGECQVLGMTQCAPSGACVPHGSCPPNLECQVLGMTQCAPSGACVPHGSCPLNPSGQLTCEYIAIGSYRCSCPAGWSGLNCEVFDDCESSPCQNGAACLDASRVLDACSSVAGVADCSASYHCECIDGFAGPQCEHDIDECAAAPCAAPKQCIDSNSVTEAEVLGAYGDVAPGEYLCVCPAGFSGSDCALNVDDCTIDGEDTCLNGGACRDQTASVLCTCTSGYIGAARFDEYGQLQQRGCATEVDECTQDFGAIDRAIAIFTHSVFPQEPTEEELGEINACGYRRLCIDEIAAYRCPVVDCNGTLDGGLEFDACRVCDGDNTTCIGCDGVPVLDERDRKRLDRCGVCGGDGLSCLGCDGTPNSGLHFDACGVCGGDNSTCIGCDNIPNSGKVIDACRVCGGDGVCRRTIAVTEPLTFASTVSATTIQASVAAMLAVPMSEIHVEITTIVQKVEQSLNLRGTAGDFASNASRDILREGFVTMLALHQREVESGELGAPGLVEDVTILAVRGEPDRRRLGVSGTDNHDSQIQIKTQSDTTTAGTATWSPPPPSISIRALQADISSDTDGDTVWIDYSVSARRDISAAFEPDVLVPGFVAAVNSLNSSAVPRLDNGSAFATLPAVQTNVSFSVKIPEARAEAADEAEAVLSTNPQSLVVLASLGPCSISPCQNGGACHDMIETSFRCECVGEWGGELCENSDFLEPPPPPPGLVPGSVVATLSLEGDLMLVAGEEGSSRRQTFFTAFKIDIATALIGVDSSQVVVISVTAGSVVVEFAVLPSDEGVPVEPAALEEAFGTVVALPTLGVTTVGPVSGVDVPVPRQAVEPSGLPDVGAADDNEVADPGTGGLPLVIIIGAGTAALLLLPILLAVCVCCWRRRTPRESKVSILLSPPWISCGRFVS